MRLAWFTGARASRVVLAALAALLAVTACTSSGNEPAATSTSSPHAVDARPNIVFVLTDDLSMNLVPYMPHIQALMQSGTSFRNYFVVDSLCCPSRSAIFTGLYPHDNGVFTNRGADGGYTAFNEFGNPDKTFAVALQASGYRTGFMGKYLNGYQPSDAAPPGWTDWVGAGDAYWQYNYTLNENGSQKSYGGKPEDYLTGVLSGKASDFVKSAAESGQPFALELATFSPHKPYEPAPQDKGTFPNIRAPHGPQWNTPPTGALPWQARVPPLSASSVKAIDTAFRRRVESVQSIDRLVGHLEEVLAEQNELDNTYFVFSSDNGYHLGEYRMRPGKQTAFDTDVRVPLVVAGPGVPGGRTVNALASSIDLAPTFLDIAGATSKHEMDGVSLLDLVRGEPVPPDWQRAILIEHHGPASAPGDPDAQAVSAGDPPSYEAMRTATALYVEYVTGAREYYNLVRDPYEMHNVVGTLRPRQLQLLHDHLRALAGCHGSAACQRAASLTSTS
jgi:arylsulfatase A-like enzyme